MLGLDDDYDFEAIHADDWNEWLFSDAPPRHKQGVKNVHTLRLMRPLLEDPQ